MKKISRSTANRYWVYKLTSPSKRVYIGITSNIIKRFGCYKNLFTEGQPFLHKSLLKYGFENFNKEILHIGLSKNEAKSLEIEYVAIYKKKRISLNLTDGGDTGNHLRGEKNRKSKIIHQYSLTKEFIKEWHGSGEIERNLDLTGSGILYACKHNTFFSQGYFWCYPDDKYKLLAFKQSKPGDTFRIPIVAFDLEGNYVQEFESAAEAARILNLSQGNIWMNLAGKKSKTGNYVWVSKSDYDLGIKPKYLQPINNSGKCVSQYTLDGIFLQSFVSIKEASKVTGMDKSSILKNCKNKTKPKKFLWEYCN